MFHNYFFLKRLASDLDKKLLGYELLTCFSQSKEELILGFASAKGGLYIKATLESEISLLHFSEDFKRAKRNSVELFHEALGKKVLSVSVTPYDRSFQFHLENNFSLFFKMHGSRSNIALIQNNETIEVLRNQLSQDLNLAPHELAKPAPAEKRFFELQGNIRETLPAAGKEILQQYFGEEYEALDLPEKWIYFNKVLEKINSNPISVYCYNDIPKLTLILPTSPSHWQTHDAMDAASHFYVEFTKYKYLDGGKNDLLKTVNQKIKKSENYLVKTKAKLEEVLNQRSYEEIANLIMANLHNHKKGQTEMVVDDFYNDAKINIALKPNVSPQKTAETLYRKSKNRKIELTKLEENISKRQAELEGHQSEREVILASEDFKQLRVLTARHQRQSKQEMEILPFHKYCFNGYDVLVGKNSKSNDELTTRIAHKNDYWLHARDVPGSHVIIRNQAAKKIPSDVLLKSAELAAWFSKRKKDSLCPVIYTEKKFVRKIKGSPAGQVRVEKESVILVEPKNHSNED